MNTLQLRFRILLALFIAIFIIAVIGFMSVEKLSLVDAFYFSIVTMATVGYGDIHPLTLPGKILVIFIIIAGVGTFLGVIANATEIILNKREKEARLEKINMMIGIFFSDAGKKLLADFSNIDPQVEAIRQALIVTNDWSEREFSRVSRLLQNYGYAVEIHILDLGNLRTFLVGQRDFLLRLLENPSLMEHERFTDLLLAVFHLTEELASRNDLTNLPNTDQAHLKTDIKRAYALLVQEWLYYMKYLKSAYPYLFSLALRTNPFDREASPIVK